MIYAIGRNPTIEALRSDNINVDKIYLQMGINPDEKIAEILGFAQQLEISVSEISKRDLDKKSNSEPHQGVIAETDLKVEKITNHDIFEAEGLYIYIRESQYEHNLGAIIRTAEVVGAKGVIIPPKQELTPVAIRISMGAAFHIPIFTGSLFPTIEHFHKNAYSVAGIERGGENVFAAQLPMNTLLIIGGEDYSLSEQVTNKCDLTLTIPQYGKINSLNMSVAAGICIYRWRQQHP